MDKLKESIAGGLYADIVSTYGLTQSIIYGQALAHKEFIELRYRQYARENTPVLFCREDPNAGTAQYESKLRDLIVKSAKDGYNVSFQKSMSIVYIYALWENRYRNAIADAACVKRDAIKNNVFGDLRIYRQSIVHNNGILDKSTIHFKFHKVGDIVIFSDDNYHEMFRQLVIAVNDISKAYLKVDKSYSLDFATRHEKKHLFAIRIDHIYDEMAKMYHV